jgi:hypothetical protein
METTLNHLLRPEMPKLKDDQIMFLFYQILRGLKYLHSCNIVHRVSSFFYLIYKSRLNLSFLKFSKRISNRLTSP